MANEDWSTLSKRLAWVIRTDRVRNQTAWSNAAGLAAGYVGNIRRGRANPSLDVIERLARAAGVSVSWLRSGDGAPDEAWSPPTAHDPLRAAIVALAQDAGDHPTVIKMLRSVESSGRPRTFEEWQDLRRTFRRAVQDELPDPHPTVPDDGAFDVDES